MKRLIYGAVVLACGCACADDWHNDVYYHVTTNGLTLCGGNLQPNCPIGSRYRTTVDPFTQQPKYDYAFRGIDLAWAQECCGERLCAPTNLSASASRFVYEPNLYKTNVLTVYHRVCDGINSKNWVKDLTKLESKTSATTSPADIAVLFPDAFYTLADFQTQSSRDELYYMEHDNYAKQKFLVDFVYGWMKRMQTYVVRGLVYHWLDDSAFTVYVPTDMEGSNPTTFGAQNEIYYHTVFVRVSYNAYTMVDPSWHDRYEAKWTLDSSKTEGQDPVSLDFNWSVYVGDYRHRGNTYGTFAANNSVYLVFRVERENNPDLNPTWTKTIKYVVVNAANCPNAVYDERRVIRMKYLGALKDTILQAAGIADDVSFPNFSATEWRDKGIQIGSSSQTGISVSAWNSLRISLVGVYPIFKLRNHTNFDSFD